jgi:hypothetical protein
VVVGADEFEVVGGVGGVGGVTGGGSVHSGAFFLGI